MRIPGYWVADSYEDAWVQSGYSYLPDTILYLGVDNDGTNLIANQEFGRTGSPGLVGLTQFALGLIRQKGLGGHSYLHVITPAIGAFWEHPQGLLLNITLGQGLNPLFAEHIHVHAPNWGTTQFGSATTVKAISQGPNCSRTKPDVTRTSNF